MSVVLFHNPQCSKSRELHAALEARGVEFETVAYLEEPPSRSDLTTLIASLLDPPAALVRQDARFHELGLDAERYSPDRADAETVVRLLLAHPELMQRPILRVGDRAAIGRPVERALALL